ncbi:hypothetical protein [Tenggerimyces flavus]|uniref:Uncharacterized protein n=1 Tax=Tenggerimyces flavus TaxID=1708749 RepID=A0ABV7YRM0_9ACTN|nr:hypothetical protein [Tenggerimyces flavus]MBM7790362.1 hypothetical protein [Tenggerimyces flavus]
MPLPPARIVDTRTGLGGSSEMLGEFVPRTYTVTGVGGVPSSGVSAVVLSVTSANSSLDSGLVVWPTGETRPSVTSLSITAGRWSTNTVITKIGPGGQVDVMNRWGETHVMFDVQGFFTDNTVTTAGGTFVPLNHDRIYDTRNGTGGSTTPLQGGVARDVQVIGVGGVPTTNVSAVAVNITVTNPSADTGLLAWPTGTTRPTVTTLSTNAGRTMSASAQVKVGIGGKISVFASNGSLDLFVDVQGYYLDNTQIGRDIFVPITPQRINSQGAMGVGGIRGVKAAGGTNTVTGAVVVRASGVTAVVVSVTATDPQGTGFFTVWPAGATRPPMSTLSYTASDNNVTNTVIVKPGSDGRINIYSSGGAPGTYVDVQGYYQKQAPPPPPTPAVSSSTQPRDAWTPTASNVSLTFSSSSTAVTRYVYATDDETMASAQSVTTTSGASKTVTITPGDGWHTVYVRSIDFANNLSPSRPTRSAPGRASPSPRRTAAPPGSPTSLVSLHRITDR